MDNFNAFKYKNIIEGPDQVTGYKIISLSVGGRHLNTSV